MKYIVLGLLIFLNNAYGANCAKHPIYCKIKSLNPRIDSKLAMRLSNLIFNGARRAGTDPMVSVGIAMQESGLRNINRRERVLTPNGLVEGISDIGFFQIHIDTAHNYGIDTIKLLNDIEYQVQAHFMILTKKIKVCSQKRAKLRVLYGLEWSCYHSYTYSARDKYIKMVGRYL